MIPQVGDIGADLELLDVDECDSSALRGAFDEHRHLDVDLLAGLDLVEVNVLDDALHRVALNILDDGHLGLVAVLDGEQSVGVTQGQGGLLHRQLHEDWILAAGVHGGRNEVGDAHAAGSALAELGTGSAFEGNGGSHGLFLLMFYSFILFRRINEP